MTNFNELPIEVQEKVKDVLKAYDRTFVTFSYGEYHVSAGIGISKTYAPDDRFIGEYKAEDIFTEEERAINYIESFHEYPPSYKGKRDFQLFNRIKGQWDIKFKFDDEGNLVIA